MSSDIINEDMIIDDDKSILESHSRTLKVCIWL